jgi:hypothetical protein
LIAACAPPLWDLWGDVRQAADNYYYKKLFSTPITTNAIVEPNAATHSPVPDPTQNPAMSSASADDDMDSVEKIDAELARMERDWAETRSGPFPEGVRNAFEDLRAEQAKLDTEAARSANDVRHVTAAATTATITAPANAATTSTAIIPAPTDTATPAIYETTTTRGRLDRTSDARHVTVAPDPVQVQTEVKRAQTAILTPTEAQAELGTTTADSNHTKTTIEQRDHAEPTEDRDEKRERRAEERERRAEE